MGIEVPDITQYTGHGNTQVRETGPGQDPHTGRHRLEKVRWMGPKSVVEMHSWSRIRIEGKQMGDNRA